MILTWFCLFVGFSMDGGAKCDDYVVGNVWEHKGSYADVNQTFQGCKKGCFWNKTYTEMGVRKCEKCEDIADEITCTNNDATCRWKGGKCKPQSCPEIANTRNTGAFVYNNAEAAVRKGRARLLKECVEGSELEKIANNQYWEDYKAKVNWQYLERNCPTTVDRCTNPCYNRGNAVTETQCYGFRGSTCVWSDSGYGTPPMGTCRQPIYCSDGRNEAECGRLSAAGCSWTPYTSTSGYCSGSFKGIPCPDFEAGKHNREHCARLGCSYTPGSGGISFSIDGSSYSVSFGDTCTVSSSCLGFTPGGDVSTQAAQTSCQNLGCSYTPVNYPIATDTPTVGCGTSVTECPSTNPAPPSLECRNNASYAPEGLLSCIDRTYPFAENRPPSVQTDGRCRLLFDIQRQRCEFQYTSLLQYPGIYVNGVNNSGGVRPGTKYDYCLQNQRILNDSYAIVNGVGTETLKVKLTDENRKKIYGFSTPEEYCNAEKEREIAFCQKTYENNVDTCFGSNSENSNALQPDTLFRNHVQTKAARTACSQIYGCMYDEKNERCSAWAVWAFVLTIVLVVVVVVAALAVVVVFVLLKVVKPVHPVESDPGKSGSAESGSVESG